MRTQPLVAVVLGALALAGCRSEEITLGFRPEIGTTYRFHYEISGTITTTIAGEAPEVSEVASTLVADQRVLSSTEGEVLAEVELRRDGGATRTAVVVLDRAGSLRGIQEIEDLPAATFGLPAAGSVLASEVVSPPAGPVVLGESWTLRDGSISAKARLARLGVIDGVQVAVVIGTIEEVIDETAIVAGSNVAQRGMLRSDTQTTFDVEDGAIRQAHTSTIGTVRASIEAPADLIAAPVEADVRYDLTVRVRRTR